MRLRQVLDRTKKGRTLITATPDTTVQDAIHLLCDNRIGALPVLNDQGHLAGIVSERDILQLCCRDATGIGTVTVSEIMTEDVITADPDEELHEVIRKMTVHGIRHLPVIENSRTVDIVSISDVLAKLHYEEELRLRTMAELLGGTYGSNVF